jgi:uncharacterized protein YlxW (UPF0749 family)
MTKANLEKIFSTLAMALLTAGVSFLWDLSKSIGELNKQVAVVIEQVASNEKHFQDQVLNQKQRLDNVEDQLRILNNRIAYITTFVNDEKSKE